MTRFRLLRSLMDGRFSGAKTLLWPGQTFPSMVSEKLVEARELAHEIVEAAAGGGELA